MEKLNILVAKFHATSDIQSFKFGPKMFLKRKQEVKIENCSENR